MKLLNYKFIKEEDVYEFTYLQSHKGVTQEVKFRHLAKEPGYSVYRAWTRAGKQRILEHIKDEMNKAFAAYKEAREKEKKDEKK